MSLGKWVLWIVISLLAAGILVAGVTWLVIAKATKPAGAPTAIPLAEQKFTYHDLPRFLVGLSDKGKARYLDLTLKLVVEGEDKKVEAAITKVDPFIIDKVQGYLMERTSDEMGGKDGKAKIQHDILQIIHEVMGTKQVTEVLVEKMIVQ